MSTTDPAAPASPAGGTDGDTLTGSLRPAFLSELARAMHAAAQQERERIAGVVDEDAAGHVEKVRARAALETEELRRLADEDVTRIEEWSASEIKRIKAEATQRTAERRTNLTQYLEQHDAIIGAEIEAVEAAVRGYAATLDAFFAELAESGDPSDIVRRAEQLPTPPDLDAIRAEARAEAVGRFAAATDDRATPTEDAPAAEPMAEATSEPMAEATSEPMAEATSEPMAEATSEPTDADATPVMATAESGTEVRGETGPVDESEAGSQPTAAIADRDIDPLIETGDPATADRDAAAEPARAEEGAGDGNGGDDGRTAAEAEPRSAVGVMDPTASSERTGWETEEPVTIGATVDHTSAAVRLLRSVAPWTAPTHDGDQRGDGGRS